MLEAQKPRPALRAMPLTLRKTSSSVNAFCSSMSVRGITVIDAGTP
jgi:hypothetical protein